MLYLHNILGGVWFVEENFAANYFPLIASHSLASAGIDIQDDRLDIILVVASV